MGISNRGGARKGAGRKPALEHIKRERITIRLPRWLIKWLKRHTNQGKAIEEAVIKYYKIKIDVHKGGETK